MTPIPDNFRRIAEVIVYDPPDWHSSADLVDAIETAIRAAVDEAVAGEREREILEYVYQQSHGDLLKSEISDESMIRLYLSAGSLRRIAAIRSRGEGEGDGST